MSTITLRSVVRMAGAIILKIAYGHTTESGRMQDPLVDLADKVLGEFSAAAEPGVWIVDFLPFRMSLF